MRCRACFGEATPPAPTKGVGGLVLLAFIFLLPFLAGYVEKKYSPVRPPTQRTSR